MISTVLLCTLKVFGDIVYLIQATWFPNFFIHISEAAQFELAV